MSQPPPDESGAAARAGPSGRSRRRLLLRGLAGTYLVLLAVSHLVWNSRPAPVQGPGRDWIELPVFTAEGATGVSQPLAYDDSGAPGTDATTLLMLHGSPGGHSDFDAIRRQLPADWRVLAPDLPGFGDSLGTWPDYSIRAHARSVLGLLEARGVERAHVVGFSMGGGVGLELVRLAPERVQSVTLLAAIGVQELELFGSYELNHAVHAMQLAALHGARWLLPHFGRFDEQPLNIPYARNFYDTDQRPLRGVLEELELPLLVLHGERDFLVPAAAAREHARVVPHGELVMMDASHFLPWLQAEETSAHLVDFVTRVESGQAARRADASPERAAAAAEPFSWGSAPPFSGPTLLVAILLLMVATLVSEDLTCVGAGLLVAQGRMGFLAASLACFLGILVGDALLFWAGRLFGRAAVERAPLKWMLSPAAVERASGWFDRQGGKVILLSRFTPGLRLPTYFAAGVLRTSFRSFLFFFAIAGVLWTPALVGLAAWLGLEALELFRGYALPAFLSLVVMVVLLRKLVLPLFGRRSRQLLVGNLRRKLHWEFWPRWAVYPPVLLYVGWLALRQRSVRVVLAVNPAIPLGGLVGESKTGILAGLGGPDHPRIAAYRLLPQGHAARLEAVRAFQEERGRDYPLVVKPDAGERGSGVHVVHGADELETVLHKLSGATMVQEFIPGPELGVFWLQRPGAERGEIYSVTKKILPAVVGDGERTVEDLILADRRAVCLAEAYFEANAARLESVPAAGESVRLVEVGTHSRGAIFIDGRDQLSPAAAETIDELSRAFEGFHFGRYDLRIEDPEAFERGAGFRVIELNGLTAEAAHVYDPAVSIVEAYRVLLGQWRLAYEIGAANRARGARAASWREVWRGLTHPRGAPAPSKPGT